MEENVSYYYVIVKTHGFKTVRLRCDSYDSALLLLASLDPRVVPHFVSIEFVSNSCNEV